MMHTAMIGVLASFFISSVQLFAVALAGRLLLLVLDAYVRSQTYDMSGEATSEDIARRFNYYAATIWQAAGAGNSLGISDIAQGFARAPAGQMILTRLGIGQKTYRDALRSSGAPDSSQDPATFLAPFAAKNQQITSGDFLSLLFARHPPLKNIFLAADITEEDLRSAAAWIEKAMNRSDRYRRWWTRERLGRVPGIGKQWAYGRTYFVNQFSREIVGNTGAGKAVICREAELHLLESSLMKQSGANAMLIGEPGAGKKTILAALADRIGRGIVFPALEDKRVMMLDGAAITGSGKTKGETEALLIKILNEAGRVGNLILVVDKFPELVASLGTLGISAVQILGPYLAGTSLHLVALADTAPFRHTIAENAGLLSHFETIYLTELDRAGLITILEEYAPSLEASQRGRILITYQTLRAVADAALNHLTDGALPKRAIDALEEAVGAAAAARADIVLPEHVMQIVSKKTHAPMGAIGADERVMLQNLEASLHKRVIGQDEAIRAIADTIRRARTAVRNPKRPIGSFLFLGPTGVGKTESAKALAAVYFGNEERMIRFDMSEYQTEEDVAKLLGSGERNDPGALAVAIRRSPYGILLLDEFEKSRQEIRNIFLQILDEGFFSDALGTRVILRDMIIIATSNAGALLIQDLVKQQKDLAAQKDIIIDAIEREAHMAPELLNRFDSLVVFRPLDPAALHAIARLMLEKLALRLKEQNYLLEITPELIDATATGGAHPEFGARPMQRFIQDHIEKAVTDGILARTITPGTPFSINPMTFAP